MSLITVLGVGNILLSDEGVGVKVIEKLEKEYIFPDNVVLLDGGTLGLGLTYFITGSERLIIVDAVKGGKEPGTIYKFNKEEILRKFNEKISFHELGLSEVLGVLSVLEREPRDIVLIGIEPEKIELGTELSQKVKERLEDLEEEVLKVLNSWGIKPLRRSVS